MSNDKVTTSTFDDFVKRFPEMAHLDPMNQIDFSLSDINQNELQALKQYFTGICTDLTLYMQLFSQEANITELNKFNGFVFSRLQRAYLERICLKVATLMDPPKSMGNENLSLRRFINQTKSSLLQNQFDLLYEFYKNSGIKDWRNKVLAHADLLTLSGENELNVNFTNQEVEAFVADIQGFIDWVTNPKVQTDHQVVLPRDVDGYSFMHKIKSQNES
ncbi:hypothetical protein G3R49_19440 [Shewanella sp. WXL01]|uniref:HEPN AbiU2-like domain-containing protein n=1 Tax=Shewanella maritima TaxID=2520507 RepID=A0A411PMA5_9GAMM|nr:MULTISPECIES: hypothetical protein [Shewanella]NKF52734.1 hypothetical protein [Shewanella sp. WXL01]QBF84635.1 hypothetical protein EXU30_19620 [Shewanella maritima]